MPSPDVGATSMTYWRPLRPLNVITKVRASASEFVAERARTSTSCSRPPGIARSAAMRMPAFEEGSASWVVGSGTAPGAPVAVFTVAYATSVLLRMSTKPRRYVVGPAELRRKDCCSLTQGRPPHQRELVAGVRGSSPRGHVR